MNNFDISSRLPNQQFFIIISAPLNMLWKVIESAADSVHFVVGNEDWYCYTETPKIPEIYIPT